MKKTLILLLLALVIVGVVWYLMQDDRSAATPLTTADFAIADTSAVGRIDITSANGITASLSRLESPTWMINNKYPARRDGIDLILKTLHLLEIKHPVSSGSRENVIRMLAGRHSYVEVFDKNDKLMKAYYVGIMTPDQQGTYMLLELPKKGRMEIPYVMTMKGFYGYLTSRFFVDEKDWRDRTILRYPKMDMQRVEVWNHVHPEWSYAVDLSNPAKLKMYSLPDNTPVQAFDTLALQDYLLQYKRVSCETWDLAFEEYQIDSVLALNPHLEIRVEAKNPEKNKHVKFFLRPPPEGQLLDDGETLAPFDREILYGTMEGEYLFRAQRYVWDGILTPRHTFTGDLEF